MLIRVAEAGDWPRIWPFFAEIVAAGETYAYPEPPDPATGRALWMPPPPGRTVVAVEGVAVEGDAVLGSATMGPNRPGRGSHVATASFMVSPRASGRGVGRRLGEHVLRWAGEAGYAAMQFNAVVAANTAAVRLWTSLGFEVLATVPEAFEHARLGRVGLHVMYRRLP
jgi:GNAT superfamily N-acetyltransferase